MNRDLPRQIALGDRGGHQRDVADLRGQPVRHRVDGVREVLPRTRHATHACLTAQLALGAHLTGHPGDLVGERGQLVDQIVDGTADLQELPAQRMPGAVRGLRPQLHARRQITLRDRGEHPADLGHGPYEIVHQGVGGVDRGRPGALTGACFQPFRELALAAHHAPHPGQLTGQMQIPVGHLVEHGRDLGHHAVAGDRQPLAEVPVPHRDEGRQQPVQGSRVHRGGPATRLALVHQGLSAFRARLRAPRRCARLHCVPPAGVDLHCRTPGAPVGRTGYCCVILPDTTRPHHGLLPALRGRHPACQDLHKKLAQCFTPAEPGHNSSAASHTVRTPSGRKHCRPASAWTAKVSNLACGCPAAPVRPARAVARKRAGIGGAAAT